MNEYIYKTLKFLATKSYLSVDDVYKFINDTFPNLPRGTRESIYLDLIEEKYVRTYSQYGLLVISNKGLSAIKNYELEYESQVILPKEANKIATEANKKASLANIISFFSMILAVISFIVSLLIALYN